MKRLSVITLGWVFVMAQLLWLAQPAVEPSPGRIPACCIARAAKSGAGSQTCLVPVRCQRSCCVQSPAMPLGQVPLVPLSPDVPRVLTGVVLTFVWSLPAAPSELATPALPLADAVQAPAVPLFARHCALLI